MRPFRPILLLVLTAFAVAVRGAAPTSDAARAPVLLISLDGFRWDYLTKYADQAPRLRQLAASGVTAEGLIPVYPSNTFPNHYAIVTGLYPSHHGIVNNHMFDPLFGEYFRYNQPKSAHDNRWWGGEPIWITAVKQGRVSACSFWPGSEAEIKGTHATYWKPFDYSVPFERRLGELVGWLKLPESQRPVVLTFYFEESNSAGHLYGPSSSEMAATVKMLDGRIGSMLDRFKAEGITVNLVVVSDHGMTECGADRVVLLDDYIDLKQIQVDFDETSGGIRPAEGVSIEQVVTALSKMPHMKVYRAGDLPRHLHVDTRTPRVPPIWIVPDEGWQVMRRGLYNTIKEKFLKGQHGYDPALPNMHGVFIANGPAFREGVRIPEFENVHIYNLLCATAGLTPAANDGDDRLVKSVLRAAK